MTKSRSGYRRGGGRPSYGKISDKRIMSLRTQTTQQLTVMEYHPDDEVEEGVAISAEVGSSYILRTYVPARRMPLTWDITAMTLEELEATRQFYNTLFDLAEPVVRERDKAAQDALAEGDDTFQRIYRPVPQLITRQRKVGQHTEGVHNGSSNDADGAGDGQPPSGGVRGDGDELVDGEPGSGVSQDNGPTAH